MKCLKVHKVITCIGVDILIHGKEYKHSGEGSTDKSREEKAWEDLLCFVKKWYRDSKMVME